MPRWRVNRYVRKPTRAAVVSVCHVMTEHGRSRELVHRSPSTILPGWCGQWGCYWLSNTKPASLPPPCCFVSRFPHNLPSVGIQRLVVRLSLVHVIYKRALGLLPNRMEREDCHGRSDGHLWQRQQQQQPRLPGCLCRGRKWENHCSVLGRTGLICKVSSSACMDGLRGGWARRQPAWCVPSAFVFDWYLPPTCPPSLLK